MTPTTPTRAGTARRSAPGGRRRQSGLPRTDGASLGDFWDAVLALSDDPSPANVDTYLAASRALEKGAGRRRPQRASKPRR